ncbi:hypothetical protein MTR67_014463 [Solanum verrucosum]|uniref:DUF4408 domain-containing protein n=1 Tax=Solanum verrucosum TaxID=315347 RepID=A0AAF0QEH4_SOLVR|nr:hypothetical protein MTR67_014463 [Solanum verrucosum]
MVSLIKFGLTMELLLLSTGLISTFFMLKKTISPYYLFNMFFVNLSEILNYLKSFLSSPFYICLFINSVVILILTFSKFQHTIKKFIDIFLDENDVDYDDIQIQPQAYHQEKEEYMPNRTNSAIAMDTLMSFFNRYNSHPDIQDDMPTTTTTPQSQISWGRLKAKLDCPRTTTTTLPQSQTRRDRLRAKANSAKTTLPQSQTSWDRVSAKIDSSPKTTTTTLPRSQISRDGLRVKANSAQTTETKTTLPHSQTSWDRLSAKIDISQQTLHNFRDISHLTEAREIVSPHLSDHETITRTNYQENIEEGELEGDSLEATWEAITKKKELKKSFTFNDALSMSRIGGLRGDISVSTEESNKKFDDFIKKINQDRLLQRQESVNMLNRAR